MGFAVIYFVMQSKQHRVDRAGAAPEATGVEMAMKGAGKTMLTRIRSALGLFVFSLVVSGITAFPLQVELNWFARVFDDPTNGLDRWIHIVRDGLNDTYAKYPWMAYGTDWLAFAHLVIALFFIGPMINPVRNISVIYAGLAACALVVPLALICGAIREIPFGWRLIDCSFGVFGAIPLLYALSLTKRMTTL